jgi:spermidine dehydrogenase
VPAYEAAEHGSVGFNGLGLKLEELFSEGSFSFHFPDGNASVARLLISRIVPNSFAGTQNMDTIVNAKADYMQLDLPTNPVRVRLSSPVVRVTHEGSANTPTGVLVAYRKDGKVQAVRGKFCIMACWNMVTPLLIPELPEAQKKGLTYGVKVPMLYTNVVIRNWTSFQELGVSRVSCPDMYYPSVGIDTGNNVGGYKAVGLPEEPVNVHLTRSPNKPGLPNRKDQNAAGQQELLTMSFTDHERIIRDQLQRVLGAGGFKAADDILAITVNRWPYGYAYTYDTLGDPEMPEEERPHVVGRKRFGRIAIANCDSGAGAFTNQAMDEASRAVQELFLLQGLR